VDESDIFVSTLPGGGGSWLEPVRIDLKAGYELKHISGYRDYSPRARAALDAEIKKKLDLGVIEVCHDAPVVALVLIKKGDGFRVCTDARPINDGVEFQPFNPPPVDQILRSMAGKPFKARFDLISAYWQVSIVPEDRYKTAFRVGHVVYRYRRMPMGFVQASSHLQRCLSQILGKFLGHNVVIYIDDIIIFAATVDEFSYVVIEVIKILKNNNLYLKREKCVIGAEELTVLGHVVGLDSMRMADDRIHEITSLPFPKNPKELRRALGQMNFQRGYVPNYSVLAAPLFNLVNGTTSEMQTESAKLAWHNLLTAVASQVNLQFLNYSEALVLRVDASILGVGAALFNIRVTADERTERLLGVASHAFTKAERVWKTIEQEAFAVVFGCRYWYGILWGQCFMVEGDHKNLQYIHQGSSPKVIRWSMFLQSLSFWYKHISGEENWWADALSRRDFLGRPVVLPDLESFDEEHLIPASVPVEVSDVGVHKLVRTLTRSTKRQTSGTNLVSPSPGPDIRVVELSDAEKCDAISKAHNSLEGHHGINRTLAILQSMGARWPKMAKDVTTFISECIVCQKETARIQSTGESRSSLRKFAIFEEISIDFIGPLPEDVLGNTFILSIICEFSNFTELFAVEAATAVVTAHVLINVCSRYGVPARIRSDRGSHFVNELVQELTRVFGIVSVFSPPYYPQANGMIERNGREIMKHLRALVILPEVKALWSVVLPLVARILNKTFRSYLGCAPNDLVYLTPPALDRGFTRFFEPERVVSELVPVSHDFLKTLVTTQEALLDATALRLLAEQQELKKKDPVTVGRNFDTGDLVLLSYPTAKPSKLHARVAGPFRVLKIEGNLVTCTDITGSRELQRDISMIIPFRFPSSMQDSDLLAVAAGDLGESVVAEIVAHRGDVKKKSTLEFQVRWEDGDLTWESYDKVKQLQELDQYIDRCKDVKLFRAMGKRK